MKIETLKEAIDLSETLNFTKTAANRYITQPALSRHIAALEDELGVTIFDREKHNVRLADGADAVIEQMRKVVAEYDELLSVTERIEEGFSAHLRIGYAIAASRPFIAHASALFERTHPNVYVDYVPLTPKQTRQSIQTGESDLVFTSTTFIDIEAPLTSVKIYDDGYALAVGLDSDLAQRDSVTIDDLAGREVILTMEDYSPTMAQAHKEFYGSVDYVPSKRRWHGGIEDASMIIASGAVMPMLAHAKFYGERSYRLIPFEGVPFPPTSVVAVYNEKAGNAYIDDFIALAKSCYDEAVQAGLA